MPEFQVDGKNILDIAEIVSSSSTLTKATAFTTASLKSIVPSGKALVSAPADWFSHDVCAGRLKVNDNTVTTAKRGTRPILGTGYVDGTYLEDRRLEVWERVSSSGSYETVVTIELKDDGNTYINGTSAGKLSTFMFQLIGAGGGSGSGGYSMLGNAHGGGGGGGGGVIIGLIDLIAMKRDTGYSFITAHIGDGGSGGVNEGDALAGGPSYISLGNYSLSAPVALPSLPSNKLVLCIAGGGGGGIGDHRDHKGGGGGSAGGYRKQADNSYWKCLAACNGGSGGSAGSAGGDSSDSYSVINATFPDGLSFGVFKVPGGRAGSGEKSRGGGGGGASGRVIDDATESGGHGASNISNAWSNGYWGGGAGGAGANGSMSGPGNPGINGSDGMFAIYYNKAVADGYKKGSIIL